MIIFIFLAVGAFVVGLQLAVVLFFWALFPNFMRCLCAGVNALLAILCCAALNSAGFVLAFFFGAISWFFWTTVPRILDGPKWKQLGIYRPVDLWTPKAPALHEPPVKPTPFVSSPRIDPFAGKRWVHDENPGG